MEILDQGNQGKNGNFDQGYQGKMKILVREIRENYLEKALGTLGQSHSSIPLLTF